MAREPSKARSVGAEHRPRIVGFASGTNLLTNTGYRPIETLRKGDCLVTLMGHDSLYAPIVWIGRRNQGANARGFSEAPVRLRPHAVGPDMPGRDLVLAPEHGIFLDGKFYLPRHLVNAASILREDRQFGAFWAVQLPRHGVIVADGVSVESFLDDGGRAAFTEVTAPRLSIVDNLIRRSADA